MGKEKAKREGKDGRLKKGESGMRSSAVFHHGLGKTKKQSVR